MHGQNVRNPNYQSCRTRFWSTVGSANIDYWSFLYSNEENAVVINGDFGARMEEMFSEDIRDSVEIRLPEWEKRSFGETVKEGLARLFARML